MAKESPLEEGIPQAARKHQGGGAMMIRM
eukprot:gene27058-biopygen17622